METIIKEAFEIGLQSRYDNILKQFKLWDDNGINEVNLTALFAESLMISLKDADSFFCLELKLKSGDKNNRIDGLVYSPKNNSIFFIESKKFKRSQLKYQKSLDNDIARILNENNRQELIKGIFSNPEKLDQYCVFIADHWKKKNSDETVKEWFSKYDNTNLALKNEHKDFVNIYSNYLTSIETKDETYLIFILVLKRK